MFGILGAYVLSWLCALVPGSPTLHAAPRKAVYSAAPESKRVVTARVWQGLFSTHLQIASLGRLPRDPEIDEIEPEPEVVTEAFFPGWSTMAKAWPVRPLTCDQALERTSIVGGQVPTRLSYTEEAFGPLIPIARATSIQSLNDGEIVETYGGIPVSRREWFLLNPKSPFYLSRFWIALPLVPVWPGFLVYTAAIAAIYLGLKELQINRRRKLNLCTNCRYDLRGNTSGICPECGTVMADRKPAAVAVQE
ncbi:MAG: hypothetical protein DCC75_04980 [Proteobacteria bacterium]|nr:MAG: hypothetical protein DCC75_04980 [Pseudomonadota bacterium]